MILPCDKLIWRTKINTCEKVKTIRQYKTKVTS